jgi:hypothetical protein
MARVSEWSKEAIRAKNLREQTESAKSEENDLPAGVQPLGSKAVDLGCQKETLQAYRDSIRGLRADRQNADKNHDAAEVERIDREIEGVQAAIRKTCGLAGRLRDTSAADRMAVRNAIACVAKLCREAWGMPRFADHLKLIRTGAHCTWAGESC